MQGENHNSQDLSSKSWQPSLPQWSMAVADVPGMFIKQRLHVSVHKTQVEPSHYGLWPDTPGYCLEVNTNEVWYKPNASSQNLPPGQDSDFQAVALNANWGTHCSTELYKHLFLTAKYKTNIHLHLKPQGCPFPACCSATFFMKGSYGLACKIWHQRLTVLFCYIKPVLKSHTGIWSW